MAEVLRQIVIGALIALIGSVASAADGHPTDDPTLRPYQYRVADYLRPCEKRDLSSVEKGGCLADGIKKLRILLKSELQKQAAEDDSTAAEDEVGGKSGQDRAVILKRNNTRIQKAWEVYSKASCDAVAESWAIGGGNGGSISTANCIIRHLVQRLNELRG